MASKTSNQYMGFLNFTFTGANVGKNLHWIYTLQKIALEWLSQKKKLNRTLDIKFQQNFKTNCLMVHSHLRFSQLLREPELIVEEWVTLYYMGAFTPAIWSTIAWSEKFNNGLCTHFLRLRGLKSSRNSSRLKTVSESVRSECSSCRVFQESTFELWVLKSLWSTSV